jgi:anaerobic magnesium-protoporphyrin IX monomethyl ester cyclase
MPYVRAMARSLKRILPDLRVVIGGPQATFLPDAALAALPEIDFVSRGEGELAIAALAEALEGGDEEGAVPGVTRRLARGECLTGPNPPLPDDLDGYPSPWTSGVLDPEATDESIMLGSRGCRASCPFCYTPAATGRRIRAHSVERVLEDIAWVARRGTGRLWFGDPNFSFSEKRVRAILEGILHHGLEVEM